MEFRRIREDEIESITEYIKLLLYMNGSLSNLTELVYDGKKYILSFEGDCTAAILNGGDELKPFIIKDSDPLYKIFGTDKLVYNILDSEVKEVAMTMVDESLETRVTFLPRIDDHPRDKIEFSQYKKDINTLVEFTYDVTERKTLDSALHYTRYHMPDTVRVQDLREFLKFVYRKDYHFALGVGEDTVYYAPLFVFKDHWIGTKKQAYDGYNIMKQVEGFGLNKNIPEDLCSLITDRNEDYKVLRLIDQEYKKYLKEQ